MQNQSFKDKSSNKFALSSNKEKMNPLIPSKSKVKIPQNFNPNNTNNSKTNEFANNNEENIFYQMHLEPPAPSNPELNSHPKIFSKHKIKKYWKNQTPSLLHRGGSPSAAFIDKSFPPSLNSLMSLDKSGKYLDDAYYQKHKRNFDEIGAIAPQIKWVRAAKFLKNAVLFENIEISDIKQGKLGNCYFLSAISSLAEYPEILKSLFKTEEINESGFYEIIFCIDGEWQIVIIDDYIPVYKGKPLSARPNGNEIWVLLLEKAFAKLNGGYTNMIGGMPREVFNLLGFRTKNFKINLFNTRYLAEKLLSYNSKNCVMCCSTKANKELVESVGLKAAHAYSLIEAKEYIQKNKNLKEGNDGKLTSKKKNIKLNASEKPRKNSNSNNNFDKTSQNEQVYTDSEDEGERERIFLLELRNPWGRVEPDLDWNDQSSLWTPELKKYFGFPKQEQINKKMEDGIFFISLEDFYKYFNSIEVSYPCYTLNTKTIHFDELDLNLDTPVLFNFEIFERAKVHLVLNVPYWRFNREKESNSVDEANETDEKLNDKSENFSSRKNPKIIFLAKYSQDLKKLIYLDYKFNTSSESLYMHNTLDKGIYTVYCFYGVNQLGNRRCEGLKLSLKSTSFFYFDYFKNDENFEVLRDLISERIEEKNFLGILKNNFSCVFDDFKNSGICYYSIINNSEFFYETVLDVSEIKEKFVIISPFVYNDLSQKDEDFEMLERARFAEQSNREKFIVKNNNRKENQKEESFEEEDKEEQEQEEEEANEIEESLQMELKEFREKNYWKRNDFGSFLDKLSHNNANKLLEKLNDKSSVFNSLLRNYYEKKLLEVNQNIINYRTEVINLNANNDLNY